MQLYEKDSSNAQLKRPHVYGDDSLQPSKQLQERRNAHFFPYFPSFRDILESVMSGDDHMFRNDMLYYHIYLSEVLKFSLKRQGKISCQKTGLTFIFIIENYGHIV